jgi:hypothetical protein
MQLKVPPAKATVDANSFRRVLVNLLRCDDGLDSSILSSSESRTLLQGSRSLRGSRPLALKVRFMARSASVKIAGQPRALDITEHRPVSSDCAKIRGIPSRCGTLLTWRPNRVTWVGGLVEPSWKFAPSIDFSLSSASRVSHNCNLSGEPGMRAVGT